MPALPYFPLYPKDIFTDDRMNELRPEERGLFLLLLCKLWINENDLKDNDTRISRILEISEKKWKELKARLMESGLLTISENGHLRNNRLTSEINKSIDKSQKALKGALAKWGNERAAKQKSKKEENDDAAFFHSGKPIIPVYDDDDGMQLD